MQGSLSACSPARPARSLRCNPWKGWNAAQFSLAPAVLVANIARVLTSESHSLRCVSVVVMAVSLEQVAGRGEAQPHVIQGGHAA